MTGSQIPIRPAHAQDVPRLAELRAMFLQELKYEFDPRRCRAETEAFLAAHLNTSLHVLVAQDKDTLAACAFLLVQPQLYHPRIESGPSGEVLNVYTVPAYRNQGLAARLMQEVYALAKRLGLGSLRLSATAAGRALYEGMGFTEIKSVHPLMVLSLTNHPA